MTTLLPMRWRGPRGALAVLRLAVWAFRHRDGLTAIHANGTGDMVLGLLAARLSGRTLVVWVHDQRPKRMAQRVAPVVRRSGGRVRWAAVSEYAASLVVAAGLAPSIDQVHIVPNPVEPCAGDSDSSVGERDGPLIVGFLGGDTTRKGFDLLPEIIDATSDLDVRFEIFMNTAR